MTVIRNKGVYIVAMVAILAILVGAMLMSIPALAAEEGYVDWGGSAAKSYAGGTGKADNPYQISTPAQLKFFASRINAGKDAESYFVLTNDIYYNDPTLVEKWENGESVGYKWTPAGTSNKLFMGQFDGAGYTIYGLYVSTSAQYQGFIGRTKYGLVQNLTIKDSFIYGGANTGAFIGGAGVSADVINCTNYATVMSRSQYVGGIVGGSVASSSSIHVESAGPTFSVIGCKNYGKVVSESMGFAGGIMGYINAGRSRGTIADCENYGEVVGVKAASSIGGILGGLRNVYNVGHCFVEDCVNYGNVSGVNLIGGIVGLTNETEIYNSVNHGAVTGEKYVGGIAGGTSAPHTKDIIEIEGCVNRGDVSGNESVGGVVGQGISMEVNNCANLGNVTGDNKAGGVVGAFGSKMDAIPTYVRACYNVGDVAGKTNVGGIAGAIVAGNAACPTVEYCFNTGAAPVSIASVEGSFASNHDKNKNYTLGTGDDYAKGVASLAGSAGLDATTLAECGKYVAGIEHPILPDAPLALQNEETLVQITSAEVRYNREGRDIGMKVNAEVAQSSHGGISYGFVILPTDMIEGPLTVDTEGALVVPANWFSSEAAFNAVLTGIPEEAYLRGLTYIAYAKVGGGYAYSKALEISYSEAAKLTVDSGVTDSAVTAIAGKVELTTVDKLHLIAVGVTSFDHEYLGDFECQYKSAMDIEITYEVSDGSVGRVMMDQFRAMKAGKTTVTVTATTEYGSASSTVEVYVGGAANDTVIVNQYAPQDNVMTLYCNIVYHKPQTISKNDAFTFDYNGFVFMNDGGNSTSTALDHLMTIRERYMRAAGFGDEEIASPKYKLEYVWSLSHYHGDHYGGFNSHLYKSEYVIVKEAYIPSTTNYASMQSTITKNVKTNNPDATVYNVNFGELITKEFVPGFTVDIMGSVYNWHTSASSVDKENSSCMWVRVSCNDRAFLLTGDTYDDTGTVNGVTTSGVEAMYNYYKNYEGKNYLLCDVIKSMHHGRLSYCTDLFKMIEVKYTICACLFGEDDTMIIQDTVKTGDVINLENGAYFTVTADGTLTCSEESSYERNEKGYIVAVREH